MSMELMKNIKALTIVQLKQNKNKLIYINCFMAGLILISNINIMFLNKLVESDTFFINVNKTLPIFIYGICIASAFFSTDLLTNKRISMYPGTSKSRFISRIIADNIFILEIVIFSFFIYCIEYPILIAIKGGNADISLAFVFDLKYALVSIVYILSYYFMAYGLCALLYSLATILGTKKTILYYTSTLILLIILVKFKVISLINLINYFKNENNLGFFVLKTLSIWFITMISAFLIAVRLKIFKEEISVKFVIAAIGVAAVIILSFSSVSSATYSRTYSYVSEYGELKNNHIYKETLVKCNYLNVKEINNNNKSNVDIRLAISQESAYNEGILDNKISLQDEVLVITFFPDDKCNNKYLYQPYLDNMTISNEGLLLKFNIPNTKTILNFLWGSSYKFLSNYDIDDNDAISNPNLKPIVYIIYPENIVPK